MKMKIGKIILISACSLLVLALFLSTLYFGVLSSKSGGRSLGLEDSFSRPSYIPTSSTPPSYKSVNGGSSLQETETVSQFSNMNFNDYGTNVFIDADKDPLSTFALDVDTASYTIAKQYILRGELPPPDAIRPEEFVNYFDYGYVAPQEGFAIYSSYAVNQLKDYVHIGIKAADAPETARVNLVLVVDVSGSMTIDNRSGLVKRSIEYLASQLDEQDNIAIVKYNTDATVVLNMTSATDEDALASAIEKLRPSGSTNVQAGLLAGYELALNHLDSSAQNRVILFSDGVANAGETGPQELIDQLTEYTEEGITFTALGFGLGNYNDVLMETIADDVDGNYAYINEFSETQRVLGDQLMATLYMVAKDAKVQVEFNPDYISSYRLVGYENRAIADDDFRNDSVDAGEIGAGHEVTAVYEVKYSSADIPKQGESLFATVRLRYIDVSSGEQKEILQYLRAKNRVYFDQQVGYDDARLAFLAAHFAQILKRSAPPPEIHDVARELDKLELVGEEELEFKEVVFNTKRLIEIAQGR
jgi:Ca-activated chloride channel homolog